MAIDKAAEEAKKTTQALQNAAQAAPEPAPPAEAEDDEPENQQEQAKKSEDDPSLTDKFLKKSADIGWDSMKSAVTEAPPKDDNVMADLVKRGVQLAVGGAIFGTAKLAQGAKALGEMAFEDSEKARRVPEDGQEDSLTLSSPHSFFKGAYDKQQEAKETKEAEEDDSLRLG
ncbi:MAG TPA: hypothetical protein VHE99_12205 [Gammaproteobacteria bacterium]|nr:hypothetical protein [Gammaproteobacteria bacterium]